MYACQEKDRLFLKADGFIILTRKLALTFLPPHSLNVDAVYKDIVIGKVINKTIRGGGQNNSLLCCNAKYENLNALLQHSPEKYNIAANALLEDLTENGEIDILKQFKALSFYILIKMFRTYNKQLY